MKVIARIKNSFPQNDIMVETDGNQKEIIIQSKPSGLGSSINGAELLFLSLRTCFCNDIYREAACRKKNTQSVDVTVFGDFGKEGGSAINISYQTHKHSNASQKEITKLIDQVDKNAEIHNTIRKGMSVTLE